jgi:hypothetical protein
LKERPKMTKAEAKDWDGQLIEAWLDLRPRARSLCADRGLAARAAKRAAEVPPDGQADREEQLSSILFGLADADFPLSVASFSKVVRSVLELSDESPIPGFTKYATKLRPMLAAFGFVEDAGDIPQARKYIKTLPCSVKHPGVCANRDSSIYEPLKDAAAGLVALCCEANLRGGFYEVRCKRADTGGDVRIVVFLAYLRKGNPRAMVTAVCDQSGFPSIRFASDAFGLQFQTGPGLLRSAFLEAEAAGTCIAAVSIVPLRHRNNRASLCDAYILGSAGDELVWRPGEKKDRGTKRKKDAAAEVCANAALVAAFGKLGPTSKRPKTASSSKTQTSLGTGSTRTGEEESASNFDDEDSAREICSDDGGDDDAPAPSDSDDDGGDDGDIGRAVHPSPSSSHVSAKAGQAAPSPSADGGAGSSADGGAVSLLRPKGDKYIRVLMGCGFVVVNKSNESLDSECSICGGSKDRKWTEKKGAKSARTLAQGRPLGSHFAWLNLDNGCPGLAKEHNDMWNTLPFKDRVDWRKHYEQVDELKVFFERERPARVDEFDGEPAIPP